MNLLNTNLTLKKSENQKKILIAILCSILFLFPHCKRSTTYENLLRENIDYDGKDGETLEGYLSYSKDLPRKAPGILIIHDWSGLDDYARARADMVAKLGYVAFAMDMYGKGKRAQNHEEARTLMLGQLQNPKKMLSRMMTSLKFLQEHPQVAAEKGQVAIGYCFGGRAVMELAYSNADLAGVVSFHGTLTVPTVAQTKAIRGRILIHHGADDSYVSRKDVAAIKKTLSDARVTYDFVEHPGAVHSFTRWDAGSDNASGSAYNEAADKASWESMKEMLTEIF